MQIISSPNLLLFSPRELSQWMAFNVPNCLSQKLEVILNAPAPFPLTLISDCRFHLLLLESIHSSPTCIYCLHSSHYPISLNNWNSLLTWLPDPVLTWGWKIQTAVMSLHCLKPLDWLFTLPQDIKSLMWLLRPWVSTDLSSLSSFLCPCHSLHLEHSPLSMSHSLTGLRPIHRSHLNTNSTSSRKLSLTHKPE